MVTPNTETDTPPDQILDLSQAPNEEQAGSDPATFITWWEDRIIKAKKFWEKDFKRMKEDSMFVEGIQWPNQTAEDDRYVVNLCQSEVTAAVSTLYAKNPTFTVKRKPRMDFAIWDESPETLQNAQLLAQTALAENQPMPPEIKALLDDINQGKLKRSQLDRIARTLEIVFDHQIDQQHPTFKGEMKQMIRRIETHGVGYVKLDFQRLNELSPEDVTKIADLTSRLAHIEQLSQNEENAAGKDLQKEAEELRVSIQTLQEQESVVAKEGLLFHFPRVPMLIPDPACTQLRGFVGARFLAEEFHLTRSQIQEVYKKDVGTSGTAYSRERVEGTEGWSIGKKKDANERDFDDVFRVWEVYHLDSGSVFTICEGFSEYLRAPAAPKILLERFYPYYTLAFNEAEGESTIYPKSTVRLIRHPQKEFNRSKEALRQHRIASKPHYVTTDGALDEEDQTNMETAPAHAIIKLKALQPGTKVEDLFQQIKKHNIDQNVYETGSIRDDIRLITRRSEASVGGVSRATATADSIAEDSRQVEDRSKADDLDELLTELAKDAGVVCLMNMDKSQVQKIAGVGAMWPESDPIELIEELFLEVQAGSSGRPNRALEVATFQRLFPILVQTPGINPPWLAKTAIKLADANVDLTEAYLEGMPSIQAINVVAGLTQTNTGNPETNPAAQGAEGVNKQPRPEDPDQQFTVNQGANDIPETATQNSILQQG